MRACASKDTMSTVKNRRSLVALIVEKIEGLVEFKRNLAEGGQVLQLVGHRFSRMIVISYSSYHEIQGSILSSYACLDVPSNSQRFLALASLCSVRFVQRTEQPFPAQMHLAVSQILFYRRERESFVCVVLKVYEEVERTEKSTFPSRGGVISELCALSRFLRCFFERATFLGRRAGTNP